MNLSVHTYVFGQPFRLRRLRNALRHCTAHPGARRVWWTRPREIAKFCEELPQGLIPGTA
jgi:hypothetical protein